jgi:hypothetical protein
MRSAALVFGVMAMLAGPRAAQAHRPELVVTAGGGLGGVFQSEGCLDGLGGCKLRRDSGTVLLGAGLFDVSNGGVRGALRLEGSMALGQGRGHHADVLGIVGWQGERLVIEGGMGSALLWSARSGTASHEFGGLFHAGLGVRLDPSLVVLARGDLVVGNHLGSRFLGLTFEWLPLERAHR